ncbi:putative transmembrane protein 2d [SARS coronavirus ZJ0301]|uniref:Putative transmembrane protein 2d n=2 Tax=Severe acute respiratory syndrome coronavirus TaxID=694009 RepID=Q3S2C9_SARS|nr:putative transmembrane protein 2d [SARS coronavirus ZJ01]ABA02263.1 putative transmembrane protein 2d [SARS coronavirus ZJ0301]
MISWVVSLLGILGTLMLLQLVIIIINIGILDMASLGPLRETYLMCLSPLMANLAPHLLLIVIGH